MKKLFFGALLTGLCALNTMAWAIGPGLYCSSTGGDEGFNGKLVICRLDGDQAAKKLAPLEVFSITSYDGVEPITLYAGVLNQNNENEAVGTVLYSMGNGDRYECGWNNQFRAGTWLGDFKKTKPNIVIKKEATGLGFTNLPGAEPLQVTTSKDYKFTNANFSGENELALKIVALAKVRTLWEEKLKLKDQTYKFTHNDAAKKHIVEVLEAGISKEYEITDDLSRIGNIYDRGNKTQELIATTPKPVVFGNARITGTEVLVREAPNRACAIRGTVNTGDRIAVQRYEQGAYVDGQYQWAYVQLTNGTYGYIYGRYVKED